MTDILEKTSDGFFALDSDWNFTYLNAEAEQMLGPPARTLLGQNFWEKFPHLSGRSSRRTIARSCATRSRSNSKRSDGDGSRWFEIHSYPNGGGISVFFRDITERKRTEDERLTTSKLESLGTLAGGIAHDLNNILTVISGNIGLAQLEAPATAATSSPSSPRPDRPRNMPPDFPANSSLFPRAARP